MANGDLKMTVTVTVPGGSGQPFPVIAQPTHNVSKTHRQGRGGQENNGSPKRGQNGKID